MDLKTDKYNIIERRLAYLKTRVELSNSLNLTDVNIHAENFYRDLFNRLGFSFKNTNYTAQNFAHIDLIDEDNKQAIQITSRTDNTKIKEALDGFYADNRYKDYKLQVMLISKNAKDYTTAFGYDFNHKDDVFDIKRLLAMINDLDTDKVIEIADFLDREILTDRLLSESTEVETIMSLIAFLSKDENRQLSEVSDNVDPEYKIYNRFSDHSKYLIDQYTGLSVIYYSTLNKSAASMDTVKAILISSYLKDESDHWLNVHNNNPKLALAEMVEYFYEKLSINGFRGFDKQAIRFYLLHEMIKCNVFPN